MASEMLMAREWSIGMLLYIPIRDTHIFDAYHLSIRVVPITMAVYFLPNSCYEN